MMKRHLGKKTWALVLSVLMVFTVFGSPFGAFADENDPEPGYILRYDFQDYASTIINDASGHGYAAVMRNYDQGGFEIVDENIYGKPVKALHLPGGADGGYLEFPVNLFAGRTSVTISMWVKLFTDSGYQRIWDFGNDTTSYLYLLSNGNNEGFRGYATGITDSGWSNEQGVQKGTNFARDQWVLTTVVVDGNQISLYEDGQKIGTQETTIGLAALGSTVQSFIGKGQFAEDPTNGRFAEVSIYDHALTDAQIAAMYNVEDYAVVNADAAALNPGDLSGITGNITLPTRGSNGSAVTWTTDNPAVSISGGTATVTRPPVGADNVSGKLYAHLTYNGATADTEFDITVVAEFSDQQIVEHDIAALELSGLDAVYRSFTLPARGEWNSVIVWDSEDESIISPSGNVSRPDAGEGNATVKLTATVRYGTYWKNKVFTATVLEKGAAPEIVSVETIDVTTELGSSPFFPNIVNVTYSDNSTGKLNAVWPASIPSAQYNTAGTYTVEGYLIGDDFPLTATFTVVDPAVQTHIPQADYFKLSDVSLDGSGTRLQNNMGQGVALLKTLDADRMLYNFRRTFGQDTKGATQLGGWDEPTGLLRGHSTGHFLSSLALGYAATGDQEIKTKLDYMVHELRTLQLMSHGDPAAVQVPNSTAQSAWSTDPNTWGDGFLSAYAPDHFALLEVYTPYATIWAPYYTLHKIISGFVDAYEYTGNQEALDAAKDLGKWVYKRLSACTQAQLTRMWDMYIAGEFGGFNEALSRLYQITNDDDFLKGAKLFDNTNFFNNLKVNIDDIRTRHANQHIPQIIGSLKLYEATVQAGAPEEQYFDVANNFWNMAIARYAYSIGGVGRGERFQQPYQQAADIRTNENAEFCASYNLLKLTKDLYKYDPENAMYMDYYERTLYNQILASLNPNSTANATAGGTYMMPIGPGTSRSYSNNYSSFTCCNGTNMESHVKYHEAIYFKSADALYVNLYLPSTLTWAEKGLQVKQENQFPADKTKLTFTGGSDSGIVDVKLRVPYWATDGFEVKVNGDVKFTKPEISSYVTLTGIKAGDVIEIDMPFTYHLDRTPDQLNSADVASVMYGPLVMVTRDSSTTVKTLNFTTDLSESIAKSDNGLGLTTNNMTFVPFYDAYNYAYHTYFKVNVSEDDPVNRYDVFLTNETANAGSFTVSADNVKEGGSVVITAAPNSGYKVNKLSINDRVVSIKADNTYTVRNVTETLQISGSFGLINPPMPDLTVLERSARPDAHYTASWENITRVNATNTPGSSSPGTGNGWGDWSQPVNSWGWISYTWDVAVPMDTFSIYWYDDNGGTRVPSTLRVEYLAEDGTWKETPLVAPFVASAQALNQYNTIKFAPVTTNSIRLNMQHSANGMGILRWRVSCDITKSSLQSIIADAKTAPRDKYTTESYADLDTAIAGGEAVIGNAEAASDAVLSAMQGVFMAKQALLPTKAEIQAAVDQVKDEMPDGYTAASWEGFAFELANSMAIIAKSGATTQEVNDAITDLLAAKAALKADKTPLATVLKSARLIDRAEYASEDWGAFQEAYLEAEEIFADDESTKEIIAATVAALNVAMEDLKPLNQKTELEELYDEYKDMAQGAYTDASWAEFQAALDYVALVITLPGMIQDELDLAADWLAEAYSGLKLRAAFVYLGNQIDRAQAIADGNPAQYPVAKWNAFIAVLEAALEVAEDAGSYDDADAYASAASILSAIQTLYATGWAEELLSWVNYAKDVLETPDAYIPAGIANLESVIEDAETLLADAGATDAALQQMVKDLIYAMNQLYEKGDKTALTSLVNILETYDETLYTPATWAVFEEALEAAQDVLNDVNAIEDTVLDILDTLIAAEAQLAYRVSKVSLVAAVNQAQNIIDHRSDYVASSLVGLPAALAAAQTIVNNASATQAQVDAARDALRAAIAKARMNPSKSPLLAALNAAGPLNFDLYTLSSVQPLNNLIEQAQAMLSAPDGTFDQAQIESLAKAIEDAIGALVLKPAVIAEGSAPTGGIAPVAAGSDAGILPNVADGTIFVETPIPASTDAGENAVSDGVAIADNAVPQTTTGEGASDSDSPIGQLIVIALLIAFCLCAFIAAQRRKKEQEYKA